MKPKGYYKEHRALKNLIKFVSETKKDYYLTIQTVKLCNAGHSWEHAMWIFEDYIELEKHCQDTKYAIDLSDIEEYEQLVNECNEYESWEDCKDMAIKYIEKLNFLFQDLKQYLE